jgi:hypothetical protein
MLQVVLDFYYTIAASCMRRVILVKIRSGGVSVVTRYDTLVLRTMNDFFSTMTPDEFATRYGPEPS